MSNPYDSPLQASASQDFSAGSKTMTLSRISPLSAGKVLGVLYLVIGVIVGVLMLLAAVLGVAAGGQGAGGAAIGGIVGAVLIPLFYGAAGFIGGIISAWLYNICASLIGGIEFDLKG